MAGGPEARDVELRRAVEQAPQAMWCLDARQRLRWANAAARRLMQDEQAAGKALGELVGDDALRRRLERLAADGESREATLPWPRDEAPRYLRVTAYPADDPSRCHVFTAVDVTPQHDAEILSAGLRTLLEQTLVGLYVVQDGRFVFVNAMTEQLTGYSRAELTDPAFSVYDVVFEEDRPLVGQLIRRRLANDGEPRRHEVRLLHRDGHLVHVAINGTLGRYRGRPALIGVVVDVTEREEAQREVRRRQQALREAYQRLALHIENSPLAFIDMDADFRVQLWSQRAEELFGYTADEVVGRLLIEDLQLTHPDDVERVATHVERWIDGGAPTTVVRNRNVTRDGRVRECEWYNSVIRSEDGTITAFISLVQDVTPQVEHERMLVAAKEQAEEMNRLKTAFLANMSHEVRTPLTAIIGFADVLAEEVEGVQRELVGFIRSGGTRLMETLNSVLNLAQLEGRAFHLDPRWFDLVAFAEDRLALFRLQAEQRGLELRLDVPEEQPLRVCLDASALGRIVTNLVSNALKFTPAGCITLTLRADGDAVELCVEDTGDGIDPAFLPYVFEEFRQESSGTARRYEGSGLGLAITRRLVELMHGTIAVESVKGEGTTFTVRLPRVLPEAEPPEGDAPEPGPTA